MNTLRLILLLLGMAVIAGVYFWDRLQAGKARRRARDHFDGDVAGDLDLKISARHGGDGEEDIAPLLSGLGHRDRGSAELPAGPVTTGGRAQPGGEAGAAPAVAGDIISLHVVAPPGKSFDGGAILAALRATNLEFGDMDIYHCYGMEGMRGRRPWFHLANMLEPGTFDPGSMRDFSTRGLSLFMQLPAPVDGEVVLDLMLETARELATRLGGEVVAHDRSPLTESYEEELRAHIHRAE